MEPIILASASPRRQDFFRLLELPFNCIPAEIDETPKPGLAPKEVAEDLARRKAMVVAERLKEQTGMEASESAPWVFAADTIVVLDGEIYGKPDDRDEARRTLERLAGREHGVITGMALYDRRGGGVDVRSAVCAVEFAPLSPVEIEWYLDTGEWQGAAGAYRLQERGGCLVKSIKGSPSAVAGLSLHDFYAMLRDNGYRLGA